MKRLKDFLTIDKRGKIIYQLAADLSLAEKARLIADFTTMHSKSRSWLINMHMTKRSMPFVIHGTISFRGKKQPVNKLIVQFNNTDFRRNKEEVQLVWESMNLVESYVRLTSQPYALSANSVAQTSSK
ncbi:hypothetical protein ACFQ4C_29980 [Larkinella insperata]|uniref:Nuclear transport factor 2 family protein n=1 Tax=Larkinella insperata TaxID=332158 RepID=A0ABW3QM89_9BACT